MVREDLIRKLVTGKEVLDVGSVGQTAHYDLWPLLVSSAKSVTGIDTEPSTRPNIFQGNIETYDFKRQFDLMVVGDVMEHLHNPGLFLQNARRHLRSNGRLIVTTPNAKWLTIIFKPNPTHVLWHDRFTLNHLLTTNDFEIEKFRFYVGNKPHYPWWLRPLVWRQAMFVVARPKISITP
jgi:SAM-dependent methyltransferase